MLRFNLKTICIFLFAITILVMTFLNCSGPHEADSTPSVASTLEKLGDVPYSLVGQNYLITNYKLVTSDGPIYFQVIPGCNAKCPAVVVSMPYNGISWSGDILDQQWAANFPSGALTADINGPNYVSGSGQVIAYYNNSISDTVGFGGIFLPSGVSTVLIYNRFYLGRKLEDYVKDFVKVVDYLPNFTFIDSAKLAFLGASLGGYVVFHASRKTSIKPLAIAGITPLLDLESEYAAMSTAASRITSNPTLLSAANNFFNSYLRRMNGTNLLDNSSAKLASDNLVSSALVIHDTWDTIVPISQWELFKTQRSVDSFIFQHAGAINYNTFTLDHAQASEGYTNTKVAVVYMNYILSRLLDQSQSKVIYYSSPDFFTVLSEIRLAQNRGQSISWFKGFLTDLCTPNITLKDYSTVSNFGDISGELMAGGILVNVFAQPTTIANGCSYLAAHPAIF